MRAILICGTKFDYHIKYKPISSIRLRLNSPRSFSISAPFLTPIFIINNFIKKNEIWIFEHSQKLSSKPKISQLKKITILGIDYQLFFLKTQRDSVVLLEKEQQIYANLSNLTESHVKKILEKKLRPFALKLVNYDLQKLSKQFAFRFNHVTVRNQSSRFGSCSSRGNLNFNWQIIFFPPDKFRHVLLHEVTHLEIKNHSKDFWNQLTTYDPDCKANNLWLKKEGIKLFLF